MYKESNCGSQRAHRKANWCSGGRWAKRAYRHRHNQPAVNVEEHTDKYELSIFAAGYQKSDFSLSVEDELLTVSASSPDQEPGTDRNWRRREFTPRAFSRRFELNDKIDREGISAAYTDGVLLVTLPKKEGAQSSKHDIFVS